MRKLRNKLVKFFYWKTQDDADMSVREILKLLNSIFKNDLFLKIQF